MSPFAMTLYTNEAGELMQDVLTASIRTGQTDTVQRYGRYYALTVVRWLSEVFSDLSRSASYTHNVDAFFGMWEHFRLTRSMTTF